jgi:hypothetical protein
VATVAPGCVIHDVFWAGVDLPGHRFVGASIPAAAEGAAEPESLLRSSSRVPSRGSWP